ncbi:MAG: hypothetical protein AB2704_02260, partial [Candidatus Thiodiazotropha taylori]
NQADDYKPNCKDRSWAFIFSDLNSPLCDDGLSCSDMASMVCREGRKAKKLAQQAWDDSFKSRRETPKSANSSQ